MSVCAYSFAKRAVRGAASQADAPSMQQNGWRSAVKVLNLRLMCMQAVAGTYDFSKGAENLQSSLAVVL